MGTLKTCVVLLFCLFLAVLILGLATVLFNIGPPAGATGGNHGYYSQASPVPDPEGTPPTAQDLGQEAPTVPAGQSQDPTPTNRRPTPAGTFSPPEPGELVPRSWFPALFLFSGPAGTPGPTPTKSRPTPAPVPTLTPTNTRRPPPPIP